MWSIGYGAYNSAIQFGRSVPEFLGISFETTAGMTSTLIVISVIGFCYLVGRFSRFLDQSMLKTIIYGCLALASYAMIICFLIPYVALIVTSSNKRPLESVPHESTIGDEQTDGGV